jgi:hypothetical protein
MTKAFIRSFNLLILVLSIRMYQLRATPPKLSWKKWIMSFSSRMTFVILFIWVIGYCVQVYLANFSTLNFLKTTMFGVKNISAAFTRSYRLDLLIAFNLSYQNRRQLIKILVFFITFAIWVSTFRSTIGAD